MKHFADRIKLPVMTEDILSISSRAKKAQAEDAQTIDGSIGTFLDEDKKLVLYSAVDKYLKNAASENLSYVSCLGGKQYKEAVLKFLMEDRYAELAKKYRIAFSATLGGSFACAAAFALFLERGQKVLLPHPCWPNYTLMTEFAGIDYVYYNLLRDDGSFDHIDLAKQIESLSKQDKLLLVVNDPAENPTGYSMTERDFQHLQKILKATSQKITLLFDIAYISYGPRKPTYIFDLAASLPENVLPMFAFSLSKTLSVYGLRGGALFGMFKDDNEAVIFERAMNAMIRGLYSCPTSTAVGIGTEVLKNADSNGFSDELESYKKILAERCHLLITNLKQEGIKVIDNECSFYITFYCRSAYKLCAALEKQKVFLVPLSDNMVRVAVSGLTKSEIARLVLILKGIIEI